MASGIGLSEDQKRFILQHKDDMFKRQIATTLSISQTSVRKFIQKSEQEELQE
jgi:DNA-binding transcriptional regulator LsrR (DeoR family)